MRFDVVGELTAHMTPAGGVELARTRRTRRPQRWTGVSRTVRVQATFEGGSAELDVFRGVVSMRGISDGYGDTFTTFVGAGRYLGAQNALRRWRREAGTWVESQRQLARIAR